MEKINLLEDVILYHEVLPDGLNVYLVPNKNVSQFYITYTTKFGSVNTEFVSNGKKIKVPNGSAHFLEHLTFKMDGASADEFFAKNGCYTNAYTSFDNTTYMITGTEKFTDNLNYFIKFVETPYYTEETVANEKGIITEEVKMYDDVPENNNYYEIIKMLYKDTKYGNIISGTVEEVDSIGLDDIKNCYDAFYQSSNMFIVVTGNFDPEEAIKNIREVHQEKEVIPLEKIESTSSDEINQAYRESFDNVNESKVFIGFKIPYDKKYDKMKYYAILNTLFKINFGITDDRINDLLNKQIIASLMQVSISYMDGYFEIDFMNDTNKITEYIDAIKNIIKNLNVSEEELKRKMKLVYNSYIRIYDNEEATNDYITDLLVKYNKFVPNIYEIYKSITVDDLKYVASLINEDRMSILVSKPKGE